MCTHHAIARPRLVKALTDKHNHTSSYYLSDPCELLVGTNLVLVGVISCYRNVDYVKSLFNTKGLYV